jgi:hypothetical protein
VITVAEPVENRSLPIKRDKASYEFIRKPE